MNAPPNEERQPVQGAGVNHGIPSHAAIETYENFEAGTSSSSPSAVEGLSGAVILLFCEPSRRDRPTPGSILDRHWYRPSDWVPLEMEWVA